MYRIQEEEMRLYFEIQKTFGGERERRKADTLAQTWEVGDGDKINTPYFPCLRYTYSRAI